MRLLSVKQVDCDKQNNSTENEQTVQWSKENGQAFNRLFGGRTSQSNNDDKEVVSNRQSQSGLQNRAGRSQKRLSRQLDPAWDCELTQSDMDDIAALVQSNGTSIILEGSKLERYEQRLKKISVKYKYSQPDWSQLIPEAELEQFYGNTKSASRSPVAGVGNLDEAAYAQLNIASFGQNTYRQTYGVSALQREIDEVNGGSETEPRSGLSIEPIVLHSKPTNSSQDEFYSINGSIQTRESQSTFYSPKTIQSLQSGGNLSQGFVSPATTPVDSTRALTYQSPTSKEYKETYLLNTDDYVVPASSPASNQISDGHIGSTGAAVNLSEDSSNKLEINDNLLKLAQDTVRGYSGDVSALGRLDKPAVEDSIEATTYNAQSNPGLDSIYSSQSNIASPVSQSQNNTISSSFTRDPGLESVATSPQVAERSTAPGNDSSQPHTPKKSSSVLGKLKKQFSIGKSGSIKNEQLSEIERSSSLPQRKGSFRAKLGQVLGKVSTPRRQSFTGSSGTVFANGRPLNLDGRLGQTVDGPLSARKSSRGTFSMYAVNTDGQELTNEEAKYDQYNTTKQQAIEGPLSKEMEEHLIKSQQSQNSSSQQIISQLGDAQLSPAQQLAVVIQQEGLLEKALLTGEVGGLTLDADALVAIGTLTAESESIDTTGKVKEGESSTSTKHLELFQSLPPYVRSYLVTEASKASLEQINEQKTGQLSSSVGPRAPIRDSTLLDQYTENQLLTEDATATKDSQNTQRSIEQGQGNEIHTFHQNVYVDKGGGNDSVSVSDAGEYVENEEDVAHLQQELKEGLSMRQQKYFESSEHLGKVVSAMKETRGLSSRQPLLPGQDAGEIAAEMGPNILSADVNVYHSGFYLQQDRGPTRLYLTGGKEFYIHEDALLKNAYDTLDNAFGSIQLRRDMARMKHLAQRVQKQGPRSSRTPSAAPKPPPLPRSRRVMKSISQFNQPQSVSSRSHVPRSARSHSLNLYSDHQPRSARSSAGAPRYMQQTVSSRRRTEETAEQRQRVSVTGSFRQDVRQTTQSFRYPSATRELAPTTGPMSCRTAGDKPPWRPSGRSFREGGTSASQLSATGPVSMRESSSRL